MKLTSPAILISFDPYTVDTGDASHNFGEKVILADRREFSYGRASSTSAVGRLQIAPAPIANHANMSVTATALGSFQLALTPGATAGAANIYAEGYAVINAGINNGATYGIKGNPAITASTAFTLDLNDPIRNAALTTASKVTLVHNAHNLFIQGTSTTARGAGVALTAFAANNYGFLQVKGIASVLGDGTIAVGSAVNVGTVAGSVKAVSGTYATDLATVLMGNATIAGVDTEARPVFLNIA
jgi:hypothetical protein